MAEGYLLVSGSSTDLARFEAEITHNSKLRNSWGMAKVVPLAWKSNPRILFRMPDSNGFYEGKLPMPAKAPVLVQKPFPIRPGDMPKKPIAQPERMLVHAGAAQASLANVRNLTNQISNRVKTFAQNIFSKLRDFDQNATESLSSDIPNELFRTFSHFSFTTADVLTLKQVRSNVIKWIDQNRTKYPTLLVDRETLVKTSSTHPNPNDAPVPQEAIPEKDLKAEDYLTQEYFDRVGLAVERKEDGSIVTDDKGHAVFNIHKRARGEGTTIVVIDTAPKYGTDKVEDWSGVDVYIDLNPENRPAVYPDTFVPSKSIAQKYHGTMVANLCKTIAPDAQVILVRALTDEGTGNTDDIIQLMTYLVRSAAGKITYNDLVGVVPSATLSDPGNEYFIPEGNRFVFNLSLTLYDTASEELQAPNLYKTIDDLTNKGVLFVCAAGNKSTAGVPRAPEEPAAYGAYPGYSIDDYTQLEAKATHEEPPSNGTLVYHPYNLVIGVASSAQRARYLYASYSNSSNICAPSAEILLDAGTTIKGLPEVKRVEVDDGKGGTRKIFIYSDPDRKYVPELDAAGQPVTVDARYVRWSGTSFSTPLVAAQAALLLGKRLDDEGNPIHPTTIKEQIWNSASHPRWWNRPCEINIADSL